MKDFRNVTKFAPQDVDARNKLVECEKMYRRIEFEKAISGDEDARSALELLGDIENMAVDSLYTGPRLLEDGTITLEIAHSILAFMKAEKRLNIKYALLIMKATKAIFEAQPPVVDIKIPEDAYITVCGDIHGQYYDLLNIFETNGYPSPTHYYLFNGDFVDRGSFSVECILALLTFKMLYPGSLFLTRGNHESKSMNRVYGFEKEVQTKYSENTFKLFTEIFNDLPLAYLIEEKIFVLHGGLFSRDNVTMSEV